MKVALFVLLVATLAFGQAKMRTTFYGGGAFAVGEGSSDMNPGLSVCIEPISKFNSYFGIGGHADYTWLTDHIPTSAPSDAGGGMHMWDVGVVPKAFLPVGPDAAFAFELDPALYFTMAYAHAYGESVSSFKEYFGLTYGVSFTIRSFAVAAKFKTIIVEQDAINWMTLTIGYSSFGM